MNAHQTKLFYYCFVVLLCVAAYFNPAPSIGFIVSGVALILLTCLSALIIVLVMFFIGGLITMFK